MRRAKNQEFLKGIAAIQIKAFEEYKCILISETMNMMTDSPEKFKFKDVTRKATAAFTPFFSFSAATRGESGQYQSQSPYLGVSSRVFRQRQVSLWARAVFAALGTDSPNRENIFGMPIRGLLSTPLARSQRLIIHTLLKSRMHFSDIYQGFWHNLQTAEQSKSTWPTRNVHQDPASWPQLANLKRLIPQNLFNCWGDSTCVWPWTCKHFPSWNEAERWALPCKALTLFSSVYTGSSVAFKASRYAVSYKLTKLANNCLMDCLK